VTCKEKHTKNAKLSPSTHYSSNTLGTAGSSECYNLTKLWLLRLLGKDMKTEQLIELTSGKLNPQAAMHNLSQQMEKKDVR